MTETRLDPATTDSPTPPEIILRRDGALIECTLNRPKVLNAFSDGMRRTLAAEIPKIARDPDVYAVALTSSSAKAFSAGGDVRALSAVAKTDINAAKAYFAGEYALNWLLECFSKPTMSLIDGLCMGSGAGLTCFNTHRVAGENYKFAMPETALGLFPDVGISHVFARMPWPIGLYLGLTGRQIGRADAYWLGLVTHCIPSRHFETILPGLADAEPIDALLDGLHQDPADDGVGGTLKGDARRIAAFFSEPNLDGIAGKLAAARGDDAGFARATLELLNSRSPLSLHITDRHIRNCRSLDLRQTLIQDYRLACRCLEEPDFHEGVRALILDKDNAPLWRPAALKDVNTQAIDRFFAPLPDGELALLSRAEMQAARV